MINAGKTAVMLCHNRQTAVMLCHNRETHVLVKPSVTFNHRNVHCTAEINCLGIQITDTLKWHCHVQLLAGELCCVVLCQVAFVIKWHCHVQLLTGKLCCVVMCCVR